MPHETYLAPDERRLIARFWQSAAGFWLGELAWRAWLLVGLLIATVLLQLLVQYRLNFWNRDFFNAIERKDGADIWAQALYFALLGAASLILAIVSVWGRMTMQRKWREWLSNRLYDYWLEKCHHRRLRFMLGEHQTPEYRIAEDARVATDLPVDLVLGLLSSLLTAVTFIGVLWSVGGNLTLDAFGLALTIPGYLVIAVIVYSMLLTAAMMIIAHRLTRVMQENKRAEAELRAVGALRGLIGFSKNHPVDNEVSTHLVRLIYHPRPTSIVLFSRHPALLIWCCRRPLELRMLPAKPRQQKQTRRIPPTH